MYVSYVRTRVHIRVRDARQCGPEGAKHRRQAEAEYVSRGGGVARYEAPFRASKWTSSSLEGPLQRIAEDEQGEGGRCMGSCFHKEI